jgi:hypothetical protein
VSLEERIRFHHEIQAGQEIVVSCEFAWGEGKSFRIEQEIRLSDGTLAAEIANVGGLLMPGRVSRPYYGDAGRLAWIHRRAAAHVDYARACGCAGRMLPVPR